MFDSEEYAPGDDRHEPTGSFPATGVPGIWGPATGLSDDGAWRGNGVRSHRLPEGLETMEPGLELAGLIAGFDRSRISGYELVRLLKAESRLVSHFQAGLYRTMGEIGSLPEVNGPETSAAEIGAALHFTRRASEVEDTLARELRRHPEVLSALESGSIDLRRARVMVENLQTVDRMTALGILRRVLPEACEWTTGQVGARMRRLLMSANPEQAEVTYMAALQDRRVAVYANPDGTANLLASNLPPDRLNAIRSRIEEITRAAKGPDDKRTPDQLRADVFLDLLEGQVTGGRGRAFVNIDVDLSTLLGIDDDPGHIPGWGPVSAEMARKIVAEQVDAPWEFTALDQGRPVATGTIRRRPTTAMKRRVRSRTRTCAHPGCRRPASQADLDHTVPWSANGGTRLDNLAPLCDHHHGLKDQGWSYRHRPEGGYEFTSPLGHTYITTGQSP